MKKLCAFSLLLGSLMTTAGAAELDAANLSTVVRNLGAVNGQALACGYPDLVSRAKAIVIARVAKTRELGELFESSTQEAFLDQGKQVRPCPSRLALALTLETEAKPLLPPSAHQLTESAESPEVGINPRYLLQAANGRAIMDSDFRDQFQLITFGYTFCPDVCPTILLEMKEVLNQLGDQAGRVQALFFSLDPERDTLAHLRSYTGFFDTRILGAVGSPELVQRAAANFKIRYEKVKAPGVAAENYAMDHTAGVYLLAPGGQFLAKFPYGTTASAIIERVRAEIARRPPPRAEMTPVGR